MSSVHFKSSALLRQYGKKVSEAAAPGSWDKSLNPLEWTLHMALCQKISFASFSVEKHSQEKKGSETQCRSVLLTAVKHSAKKA